jgi:hypothetical protein
MREVPGNYAALVNHLRIYAEIAKTNGMFLGSRPAGGTFQNIPLAR